MTGWGRWGREVPALPVTGFERITHQGMTVRKGNKAWHGLRFSEFAETLMPRGKEEKLDAIVMRRLACGDERTLPAHPRDVFPACKRLLLILGSGIDAFEEGRERLASQWFTFLGRGAQGYAWIVCEALPLVGRPSPLVIFCPCYR